MSFYTSNVSETSVEYVIVPNTSKTRQMNILNFSCFNATPYTSLLIPIPNPTSFHKEQDELPYKSFKQDVEYSFLWPVSEPSYLKPVNKPLYRDATTHWEFVESVDDLIITDEQRVEFKATFPNCGCLLLLLETGMKTYGPIVWSHAINGESFVPLKKGQQVWNHKIFQIGSVNPSDRGSYAIPLSENRIRWSAISAEFRWSCHDKLSLWEAHGSKFRVHNRALP